MMKQDDAIAEIRRFNRFYTRYIGVVNSSDAEDRVLAGGSARALRAGAPGDADGDGSGEGAGDGSGVCQPHLARASAPRADRSRAIGNGWPSGAAQADREGPEDVRDARHAIARSGRGDAREPAARRPRAHDRRDAHDRRAARRAAGGAAAAAAVHPADASAWRHGLGGRASWRALRAGTRLGRHVRGAGRRDLRGVPQEVRPEEGALLDRRAGRRERRLASSS